MKFPGYFKYYFKSFPMALLWAVSELSLAWGPQGHRLAGTMTEPYLSPTALAAVHELLADETLADASTWADRMRGNPSYFWQKTAGPYHYVTVPPGKTYAEVGAPRKGDSVTALREFQRTLQDPDASRAHQQLALRFSLHIIQDLHQPMHVGNGRDRGGNKVMLIQGGKITNLHRVWDSGILGMAGRPDRKWVARLSRIPAEKAEAWSEPDPMVWIAESASLRDQVYPGGKTIDDSYAERWLPSVEQRLQQSAVRGAAWLNAVFKTP